ncbi:MAG: glycoside hydrolase family 27 protein [Candidatus Pedobacter colombiensis]|uniref:Alpha-galactosidase n=1 Tax=Candidatus Pedobacter colombiensis TaxID=3121371 RepID=A0AAJ5WCD6_9SPHI|nr:glycoside hydrolase family 27 protein [Pedobacter sp.]WEK20995.1 MAG: glycoside hydrolase family 27 protein [Pedobacter sp.]
MMQSTEKMFSGLFALLFLISILSCGTKTAEKKQAIQDTKAQNLALTPPMGWNSWNAFGKNVNEKVIRETADAMVSSGLKDAGFSYIVIDDFWQLSRDSVTGMLQADVTRFPSGIKALADYVHSKGLKFGIYSDAGTKTCGGVPGSFGYEEKDAKLFAEWGVDFLKYDYCYCPDLASTNNDYKMAIDRYKTMGDALKATGRPIVFSICEWGPRSPWLWGKEVGGHMWRTSYDVADIWDKPRNESSPIGILTSIDAAANLGRFAGPGGWNDLDMLVVGLNNTGFIKGGGCTDIEYRTQMSMWCMLASPIMLGGDIRNMSPLTKEILLNKDLIGINQDSLGKPGYRVFSKDGLEAWRKELSGNRVAIALFNRNSTNKTLTVSMEDLEMKKNETYGSVYDVWTHKIVNQAKETLAANLKPHECQVFILSN